MRNRINRKKCLSKRYIIKCLPYILLLFGLLIGSTDSLLDNYVPGNLKQLVWAIYIFLLMFIGYRTGKFIKKMYGEVYRDSLTGLANRGYFYFRMNHEIEKISNRKSGLSLVMVDIDNFKLINDIYGHLEGDKVIKNIAYVLKESIRETDAAIRWGGDEFTLILPNINEEESYKIADRIRRIVESQQYFSDNISYKATVSIGICTINEKVNSDKFLEITDDALYQAKIRKNSVVAINL